jgi:ATP-dependent Clp protease ATP-binding subunit ClpB
MEFKDPEDRRKAVNDELKRHFKPEFLNRLDDIVIFNTLDLDAITNIVDILFKSIQKKLAERDITITLTPAAKAYIAEAGFDPVYGARPLKRALYEVVEDRLAELILEDKVVEGSHVEFDVQNGEIEVHIS